MFDFLWHFGMHTLGLGIACGMLPFSYGFSKDSGGFHDVLYTASELEDLELDKDNSI